MASATADAARTVKQPLASLTLAAAGSNGAAAASHRLAASSNNSAATSALKPAPASTALRNTPAGSSRTTRPQPAPTMSRGSTTSSSSSSSATKQKHQQQRGRGHRQWTLPVAAAAAAALALHAGRAAARVLAPAAPGRQQHKSRPLAAARRVLTSLLPKRIGGGGSSPPGVPGGRKPALVWFRNDLRLHDHEPLTAACVGATSVLPVYVFDPREYGKSPNGFDKTGPYRARFLLEALQDLRARLRDAGSELVVRIGKPEEVLPKLARAVGAAGVYCYGEVTAEEGKVEAAVAKALDKAGASLKVMWGGTLFHVEDLPFQLPSMPPHYSDFRKAVRSLTVRAAVEAPQQVKGLPTASVPAGDLPSLQQLGFDAATLQRCANDTSAAGARLKGGESEALRRLSHFLTQFTHPGTTASGSSSTSTSSSSSGGPHKAGGAAAGAPNFCCKISPWLALGCLSPRQLYTQLQEKLSGQQQQQLRAAGQGSDTDMQWLLYELLWRDFFRFITKKYAMTGAAAQAAPAGATAAMALA